MPVRCPRTHSLTWYYFPMRPRKLDTHPPLAQLRYGKGALVFVTQQELEAALGGPVGRVRYKVRPVHGGVVVAFKEESVSAESR